MNMFRTLRADEIDCRIAQIKETPKGKGLSLLLYKDARCDQNILDEVVGPFNWKREHTRDNRNCIVSIKNPDNGEWVSKEDTGTESNTMQFRLSLVCSRFHLNGPTTSSRMFWSQRASL